MEEKKVILTPNTPFLNSQCIFVEYDDIIKCPSFVLLNSLRENEIANSIFDFSEVKDLSEEELFEWYQKRKYKNIFKNIPLTELGKEKFQPPEGMSVDSFFDSFLYQEYQNISGLVSVNSTLNFAQILPKLFDSNLVHGVYVYSEVYSDVIKSDLFEMYGHHIKYVSGDLKSVLKQFKIPNDSTFVFSNIKNILILDEIGKLERSSIIIPDGYGYNLKETEEGSDIYTSCVDLEALVEKVLFKIDFFENTHSYE